jgi:hypothetical protein
MRSKAGGWLAKCAFGGCANRGAGAVGVHDGMMWFTVLGALIVLVIAVLIAAALIKYLFFR